MENYGLANATTQEGPERVERAERAEVPVMEGDIMTHPSMQQRKMETTNFGVLSYSDVADAPLCVELHAPVILSHTHE